MSNALTIGFFDGVHLGHCALLKKLKEHKQSTVVTFSNHPSELLFGEPPLCLTPLPQKLTLIRKFGIDNIIILPFTTELSQKSPEEFLSPFKFSHLILGHDAVIGHKRQGTPAYLESLNFTLEYLPPILHEGKPISSSRIRDHLQKGQIAEAETLLGRPYSIEGTVIPGSGQGRILGFKTANLATEGLALPQQGVWAIKALINTSSFHGVANLGSAPTLYSNRNKILEIHLLDVDLDLYGKTIQVFFKKYLRPEQKFSSITELKDQIQIDINSSRAL